MISRRVFLKTLLGMAVGGAAVAKAEAVIAAPVPEAVLASASLPNNHQFYWYCWRHKLKDLPVLASQIVPETIGV